ncbi:hypothetical protein [Thiohalorhabdus sp.]|uniref:hypothetical protein n=1 Tax=Thiohalorhabdus sp. TaxID=3094134 RepID=UPI002FC36620
MERISEAEARRLTGAVKMEAAALVLGTPFYGLVVMVMLAGPARLLALALYSVGAALWVIGRGRRVLKNGRQG